MGLLSMIALLASVAALVHTRVQAQDLNRDEQRKDASLTRRAPEAYEVPVGPGTALLEITGMPPDVLEKARAELSDFADGATAVTGWRLLKQLMDAHDWAWGQQYFPENWNYQPHAITKYFGAEHSRRLSMGFGMFPSLRVELAEAGLDEYSVFEQLRDHLAADPATPFAGPGAEVLETLVGVDKVLDAMQYAWRETSSAAAAASVNEMARVDRERKLEAARHSIRPDGSFNAEVFF